MSWGRPRDKPSLLGAVAEEPGRSRWDPAEQCVTPWAWGGGGWQSCSWLGIGAGFLSGREGARRGERGQQQLGTPLPFSLRLLPSAGKAR